MRCRSIILGSRVVLALAVVCSCFGSHSWAVEANPQRSSVAQSPRDSLKQIAVDSGLKVELVANEPNIMSPVAVRFDEEGRMWVVQMRDYPTGPTKEDPARSRVSVLSDKDGDGFFETAVVFADDLPFATGVQPWLGGAFITMAGKVMYMKDTNGDGKADLKETWYTGFSQGNQQLRANHPRFGLDNHIYIANGLLGGKIVDARHPDAKPVSISGMDFRFDPRTRKFEAVSGMGQFGLTFDDFGNRFTCTNRNPVIHIVLEDRLLKKNPLVTVAGVVHDVAKAAGDSRLYSIGRVWTTSNLHAGTFTAACGVEVYRGDALPPEYYGNVFTCDPTARVVHREIMKADGVTFTSSRLPEEREFFATSDEWCCPVNLEVGPDGALYVVDMYRQVIEHPAWMPEELQKRKNLRAGSDRGRIYRVVRKDFERLNLPQLSEMTSKALVDQLASKNAWRHESAHRLLVQRGDKGIEPQLRQLALKNHSPVAQVQALRVLQALDLLDDKLLLQMLEDSNPRVIEQVIAVAEPRIPAEPAKRDQSPLLLRIAELTAHQDARVRFQARLTAMSLGNELKHPADEWELIAMRIAARGMSGIFLSQVLARPADLKWNVHDPKKFVVELARQAAASKEPREYLAAVYALIVNSEYGRVGLAAFLAQVSRGGESLESVRSALSSDANRELDEAFDMARRDAENSQVQEVRRCDSIDLLAFAPDGPTVLTNLAINDGSQPVRLRAIAALTLTQGFEPWKQLLGQLPAQTPSVQRAVLDGLFSSVERTSLLLDEIDAGRVKANVIDPIHAKLLLEHRDKPIKARAEKVLASAVPADRQKVLAEYQPVLTMQAEPSRGRAVFEKRCSICHKIGDIGVQLAPDISDSREKTPAQILTDIIQPNRAIDSNYFSYSATTTDGRVHTGILASETSTSVTLKQQEGRSETLRRDEIEELHNSGVSFMPEGLEKDIPLQDMADLISFIKNWRYLDADHSSTDSSPSPAAKP